MKPVHAKWVIGLYDHLRNSSDLITKGFEKAGMTEVIENEYTSLRSQFRTANYYDRTKEISSKLWNT